MVRAAFMVMTLLIVWVAASVGCKLASGPPADAAVFLIEPKNGQVVPSTFKLKFGLTGMQVTQAGVIKENSGHHHLLIDLNELPDFTLPLPATENIIHFGGGETETMLTLSPGKHTLQLLLGDFAHRPHPKPLLSEKITVIVK